MCCALLLAVNYPVHERLEAAKQLYDAISLRKLSLATPLLANLGTKHQSLASCFILGVEDSLESIFAQITNFARLSQNGGGGGICVSGLRSAGSWLRDTPNAAAGVIPWIKLLNDTACAVNQNGKRTGAITVALDVWHLDLFDFLDLQTEHGDPRRKAFDIFPQVVLPDLFLNRVEADQSWYLVDPYEVHKVLNIDLPKKHNKDFVDAYLLIEDAIKAGVITLYREVNAKHLFKQIMRSQLETGLPYLFFKDAANRANPNYHDGYIPCSNLCTESYSNVSSQYSHTCNLISLNLANIEDDELEHCCNLAVNALDTSIDLNKPSFSESGRHNQRYRVIGVGIMGLADWLVKRQKTYTDLDTIASIVETIAFYTTNASMQLAKQSTPYPAYFGSSWHSGNLLGNLPLSTIKQRSKTTLNWTRLAEDIAKYGIRNSQIMAIAPNTSSALLQGCTAGVLPVYSKFHYDKFGKASIPVAPPFIKEGFWYYKENKVTDQQIIVRAIAAIQQWIDTGISMELLFNFNSGVYKEDAITAKDVYAVLMLAWKEGCKAVYYTRSVQKTLDKSECVSCAN
jgi:ribonucleoside-diphosphate reductase alpha chain